MALIPQAKYPGQIDTGDPDYPHGRARNQVVEGDGTGTPLEKDLVNDIFGFQQALLLQTGITPSGTPDKATDSQYFLAIQNLISGYVEARLSAVESLVASLRTFAEFNISSAGIGLAAGAKFSLTEALDISPTGGFSVVGGTDIEVPEAGRYLVSLSGGFDVTSTGPSDPFPKEAAIELRTGTLQILIAALRVEVQGAGDRLLMVIDQVVNITNPSLSGARICAVAATQGLHAVDARIHVRRLPT
jgi:hypothetical protein